MPRCMPWRRKTTASVTSRPTTRRPLAMIPAAGRADLRGDLRHRRNHHRAREASDIREGRTGVAHDEPRGVAEGDRAVLGGREGRGGRAGADVRHPRRPRTVAEDAEGARGMIGGVPGERKHVPRSGGRSRPEGGQVVGQEVASGGVGYGRGGDGDFGRMKPKTVSQIACGMVVHRWKLLSWVHPFSSGWARCERCGLEAEVPLECVGAP